MSHDKTTLNQIKEDRRADDEIFITTTVSEDDYLLARFDETMKIGFSDVIAFIEHDMESAVFKGDRVNVTISNEQGEVWPHWVFEELLHIHNHGGLRPMDDYETTYRLKDNRGIRAR